MSPSERMAAHRTQCEVPFEIHLRKRIRCRTFKPLKRPVLGRLRRIQEPVTFEDGVDGGGRGHLLLPEHLKPSTDLASSPRMLCTHIEHRRLHLRGGSLGRMPRPTRAIAQALRPRLGVAPEPLVSVLRLIPKRRHNSATFVSACLANITNWCRNDMVDTSCQGMTALLLDNHHAA